MSDHVSIFDTTLRDGEQCPGASMTADQKLVIARHLEALHVDVIEAGFPAASPGDLESVRLVANEVRGPIICALARANPDDIDKAAEALAPAERKRLHTFISTSPIHMEHKLRMRPDQVLEAIDGSVRHARNLFDDVEWACEDGTRSDLDFLCRCFDTAIKAGATTVNIADTVGYTLPTEFAELVGTLRERVDGMEKVVFSVHCHDDLGLATANSIAAIASGARQVECTINGVGERAGNAALEEIVMAIRTRSDHMRVSTRVRTEELSKVSRAVSQATGFNVPPNKAVIGANAFAHESGIHQHGIIVHKQTYEIMTPQSIGVAGSRLVMGKHSGRHALRKRLEELGFTDLAEAKVNDIFRKFKALADTRKGVTDAEIVDLVKRRSNRAFTRLAFESLSLETLPDGRCSARVAVLRDGKHLDSTAEGPTWWSATHIAIVELFPDMPELSTVRLENTSYGPEPEFLAFVSLGVGGQTASATDTDPIVALARACIRALEATLIPAPNEGETSVATEGGMSL